MRAWIWGVLVLGLAAGGLAAQEKVGEPGLRALLAEKSTVVLDVRTEEEFVSGHLPGARLLPYDAIDAASASRAAPDKKAAVVVYCRSGRRSALAARTLEALGYTRVRDFGAVSGWSGPLVQGK